MEILNISSKSDDLRERELSNLMPRPFVLGGLRFRSPEGFIQGTKYPEDDPRRALAFRLAGIQAKRMGDGAKKEFIWWNSAEIPYGSGAHRALLTGAIEASFRQNPWAFAILHATRGTKLIHEVGGQSDTALPANVFCAILTKLRDEDCTEVIPELVEISLDEMFDAAELVGYGTLRAFCDAKKRYGRNIALQLLVAHLRRENTALVSTDILKERIKKVLHDWGIV
ncbi:MAG: hypothetical protein WC641_01950 [Patescibacteria group bacterium]